MSGKRLRDMALSGLLKRLRVSAAAARLPVVVPGDPASITLRLAQNAVDVQIDDIGLYEERCCGTP